MKEVSLTIDGKEVKAQDGMTILDAAKEAGIRIPTLCSHEGLSSYGACRLCSVEISRNGDGKSRIVTSCTYPVEDGLKVNTATERIAKIRKGLIELLLARCPNVKVLQDLGNEYGVVGNRFETDDETMKCIVCSLCVRVCEEVVGIAAIGPIGRGTKRRVGPPFLEEPGECIGCGACASVCPTGVIQMEDVGDTRVMRRWKQKTEFKLKKCSVCGNYFAPEAQLEHIIRKANLPTDYFDICPNCKGWAETLTIAGWTRSVGH
jgi:bidirectional [NiFe] hydrogenase diaphorase subunit